MTKHAYSSLPDHCFWRPSIANIPSSEVDPVVRAKFRIGLSDRVATAGSCFAQHIARHLRDQGFSPYVAETAHPITPSALAEAFGYGIYSARYGNIYTARQFVQLLWRAYGLFEPDDVAWLDDQGRWLDPFRPTIQPSGFISKSELDADRTQHFAAVRRMVESLDVLTFTLGLTEGWASRSDGAVYPLCPGVAGGEFSESRHVFFNQGVVDVVGDLKAAIAFVRERNPRARFIFTVSPVPLAATAENRSVLESTTYSKSVLRVAAEEVSRGTEDVAYFPSYEIVTGAHARGAYFEDDLRTVAAAGVDHVMRLFMKHYADFTVAGGQADRDDRHSNTLAALEQATAMERAVRLKCDEDLLDERGRRV